MNLAGITPNYRTVAGALPMANTPYTEPKIDTAHVEEPSDVKEEPEEEGHDSSVAELFFADTREVGDADFDEAVKRSYADKCDKEDYLPVFANPIGVQWLVLAKHQAP